MTDMYECVGEVDVDEIEYFLEEEEDGGDALSCAFSWKTTIQGYKFWDRIYLYHDLDPRDRQWLDGLYSWGQ